MAEIGARPNEPGVCHRLDYWTSGVLLAARTSPAFTAVRAAFAAHWVNKTYLALCAGSPPESFKVDRPIGHPARRATHVVVGADKGRGARPAVTEYTVLAQYADCALVRAVCATGAMHQVRAHAAYAGFPLVGDTLYGGPAVAEGRFWLHAYSLALPHPVNGQTLELICPPPATFPQARDWHAAQSVHI
jgi:23S rRNA pseudouridine1911/1915/1917 synthase